MVLHHRDRFGMIPLDVDDYSNPLHRFGIHSGASTSTSYSGPAHWRDHAPASVPTQTKTIREVDLSVTKYRTPLLYAKMHGHYVVNNQDIDEATQQWEINEEEYNRDVMREMPDWVIEFISKVPWLDDAKVKCLGPAVDDPDEPNLERISFRFSPKASDTEYEPLVITFKGVWVNQREVLPKALQTSVEEGCFIADEFAWDTVGPVGAEEFSYHFFLSTGVEYSIEGLYGIEWAEEDDDEVNLVEPTHTASAEIDRVIGEAIQRSLKRDRLPQAEPYEPETPKKKPARGKGKNGVKLFTAMFYIHDFLYVEQIRSKDWGTIWTDFQDRIESGDYDTEVDGKRLVWEEKIIPFSKDSRNVFIGQFWIDGREVDVTIVNTKRGKPPGAEEIIGLQAYIDS